MILETPMNVRARVTAVLALSLYPSAPDLVGKLPGDRGSTHHDLDLLAHAGLLQRINGSSHRRHRSTVSSADRQTMLAWRAFTASMNFSGDTSAPRSNTSKPPPSNIEATRSCRCRAGRFQPFR